MLTNRRAEIESPTVTDQGTPPPNWYTDPADESQYRYWDGSVWTEHRAPRLLEEERKTLRSPDRLFVDSFSLLRRQWRGCAVAALVLIAAQFLLIVLFRYSADQVLMGEFDETWSRFSDPATTPEDEAYFESLESDFSVSNFVAAATGLLVFWVANKLLTATVARLTLRDLRGDTITVSKVSRQAWRRDPPAHRARPSGAGVDSAARGDHRTGCCDRATAAYLGDPSGSVWVVPVESHYLVGVCRCFGRPGKIVAELRLPSCARAFVGDAWTDTAGHCGRLGRLLGGFWGDIAVRVVLGASRVDQCGAFGSGGAADYHRFSDPLLRLGWRIRLEAETIGVNRSVPGGRGDNRHRGTTLDPRR